MNSTYKLVLQIVTFIMIIMAMIGKIEMDNQGLTIIVFLLILQNLSRK